MGEGGSRVRFLDDGWSSGVRDLKGDVLTIRHDIVEEKTAGQEGSRRLFDSRP